jgi:hypothetical protein
MKFCLEIDLSKIEDSKSQWAIIVRQRLEWVQDRLRHDEPNGPITYYGVGEVGRYWMEGES